ncbi:dnaJ homolog subfamily C member 30, mitochondrial [Ahaetulla prasina]|uniref:dnaJ homolog subfamily C member 30, mitochondrial n=1 Tax=Ahaetulla prasina TaxID=499056 RepID=UPI00264999D4|nr:dnaJ homolog subfamily C member 30, mitochondrial [Ahaetulla prasina]
MALARSQRQSRAASVLASDLLWSSYGAGFRPKAALPTLVFPVAFRKRSGPGQGKNGQEGEGRGNVWRRAGPKDLYELLGVQSTATQAQIKTAYYRQSFLYHPDRNAGSVEAADRFIHITQAYQVLGSLSLRKKYDRGLLTEKDISNARKPPGKSKAAAAAAAQKMSKKPPAYTSGHPSGKPIFNFDEFYRAHYAEQLERDRLMRLKQQELQRRKESKEQEKYSLFESFLLVLFLSSVMILLRYQ